MKYIKLIYLLLFFIASGIGLTGCVDDLLDPNENTGLPEEFQEEYSITFQISLDAMGGNEYGTRAGIETRDIENFIDFERLRILFFTCDYDGKDDNEIHYYENGRQYDTGKHDVFMFESKSRWIAEVESSSANASRVWQITAPIFTYGNDDDYDWDKIREALTTKSFKIAVLANRPGTMRFGDFDGTVQNGGEFWFGNGGPYWGPEQSFDENITINELHHCQWDPVYASKNLYANSNSTQAGRDDKANFTGNSVYNFIMGNPQQTTDSIYGGKTCNMMGAVSQWTTKDAAGNSYYFHPNKESQGIPMYGVQVFNPITNWTPGTPFNISENQKGQDNSYYGKTISMLRSLVRLELLIPKEINGKKTIIKNAQLFNSNVMARCEPIDVATPTNLIWSTDNCSGSGAYPCEWTYIQAKGPLITTATFNNEDAGKGEAGTTVSFETLNKYKKKFVDKLAWYYGAWRSWWDFNDPSYPNLNPDFGSGPYPHVLNAVVQRNTSPSIMECIVPDNTYHHFVVYTGERYINDPTNFRNFKMSETKVCYFSFNITYEESSSTDGKQYEVAICDYKNNSVINKYLGSGDIFNKNNGTYYSDMADSQDPNCWNWALLRNHVYRFTIQKIDGAIDDNGFDGLVISTEERAAPSITYE